MKVRLFLLISIMIMISIACSQSNSSSTTGSAPEIEKVISMVENRGISPFTTGETATISFDIYLKDNSTRNNIDSLEVYDSEDVRWQYNKTELAEKWDDTNQVIKLTRLTSLRYHIDHIPLGNYRIITKENSKSDSTFNFTVYGRGNTSSTTGNLYSDIRINTPKILVAPSPSIARLSGNTLTVEFTLDDSIINDARITYYDTNGSIIGYSEYISDINDATALNPLGENTYSFSVSDYISNIDKYRISVYSENPIENENYTYYKAVTPKSNILRGD